MAETKKTYVATIAKDVDIGDATLLIEQSSGTVVSSDFERGTITFEAEPDDKTAIEQFADIASVADECVEEYPDGGGSENFSR